MKLDALDKRSALWQKLDAHWRTRLGILRRKNDGFLSHEETIRLRGEISQLKAFLALCGEPGDGAPTDKAEAMATDPDGVGFSEDRT